MSELENTRNFIGAALETVDPALGRVRTVNCRDINGQTLDQVKGVSSLVELALRDDAALKRDGSPHCASQRVHF